jgi:putative tricarboxylic transport membrane protein
MTTRTTVAILAVTLITLATCGGGAVAPVSPTRSVEFVISTAPGGGSDLYARTWQGIIEKNKFSPQSLTPLNKEGASGAVAFTYVYEHKGDMHYIMVTLNSFFTTLITQKLPYKATDFTPIANMALDPFFLWVNEDSAWKTAQDFVNAAKDKSITVAGTGSKQEDEALFRRIQDLAGTKPFTYLPQTAGSGVAAAVAGHQGGVEASVNNPSEGKTLYQASPRKLKPLCSFTPESPKTGIYSGLATCKSQGLAIDDYYIMRAVMAPPGLSAGQQAFWVDVFKKTFESSEWKAFMDENFLSPDFKTGSDFVKFLEQYQKVHEDIATKYNWIQQ